MRYTPKYNRFEFSDKKRDYAVVIPVINEGKRLQDLLNRMLVLKIQSGFDVIVVDGGSTDGSISEEMLRGKSVNTLLERVSPGKLGTQLQCAYHFVLQRNYKGVITLDGNNKDDPEAISRFKERLEAGVDFVQGSRFIQGGYHKNTPWLRIFAVRCIHAPSLSLASGFKWTDTTQGFRGYSLRSLQSMASILLDSRLDDYRLLFSITRHAPRLGLICEELGTRRIYPEEGAIPTKIKGLRGNLKVLVGLAQTMLMRFPD